MHRNKKSRFLHVEDREAPCVLLVVCLLVAFLIIFAVMLSGCATKARAGELDIGINYFSGQHQTRNLNLGLKVPFLNDTALFSSKVAYGSHNDEIVQNQGHLRLNYDPSINKQWSLWFYEQVGYDQPKEIELENFIGGGPKYILYKTDRSQASASLGYLYHYQEDIKASRLSLRLKGKSKLNIFEVSAIVFCQPNIEDFNDYILTGEVGVKYTLSEFRERGVGQALALKWTAEDNYRSVSPIPQKNEFVTGLKLVLSF